MQQETVQRVGTYCYRKIVRTIPGNYGSPPYVPESQFLLPVRELCFNFKRRCVLGPPASIPVTKCFRTRKYVPHCCNRSLFLPLNVLHYCQHARFFRRLPRYRAHELTRSDVHLSPPFQFACAITQTKKKERNKNEKILF